MRFLFAVPPLTGHTNPTVAVGTELRARGHEVAWCGFGSFLRHALPSDATILPVGTDLPAELVQRIQDKSQGLRGAAAFKFLWEDFLHPVAEAMVPGLHAAVDGFDPDVMIVDQQAVAGALVARQRGVRWATSATTSADLIDDPLEMLPKLRAWIDEQLIEFQVAHGVEAPDARPEALRFSDQLVLAFTTTALVGDDRSFPPHWAFVGPAFGGRPSTADFPFDWLDPDLPHVLVSLGTVNAAAGQRFYRVAFDALGDEALQAIVVAPPSLLADDSGITVVPDNIVVREQVPQLTLLPHLDTVVSHAGHNTVCESLAHGVPLVVAPIRDDQPVVASQVEAAGAGIRVKFARVRAPELRGSVWRVLREPSFRQAATRVKQSFERAGGAEAAADQLEKLALS